MGERCPVCHAVSRRGACACTGGGGGGGEGEGEGEGDHDPDKALVRLRDQRANARIGLGALIGLDLGAIAGVVFAVERDFVLLLALLLIALLGATAHVAYKLSLASTSMRELEGRAPPTARLLRG